VDALEDAYRGGDGLPDHRDEYGAILRDLKARMTHAEGWLKVMIALGDYHRNVRGDKWAGIRAYEEAFVQGGQPTVNRNDRASTRKVSTTRNWQPSTDV